MKTYTLEELQSFRIPFGKYKDLPFDDIPLTYFDWIIGQDWLKEPLRQQIEQYLNNPTIKRIAEEEGL